MRIAVAVLTCVSCAGPTIAGKGGPRGLHADEHLWMATEHDLREYSDTTWPDQRSSREMYNGVFVPFEPGYQDVPGNSHADLAYLHRSEAAAQTLEYERACGSRGIDEVATSPLKRHAIGTFDTDGGVVVYLTPEAGNADKVLADVRCYRAWMMLYALADPSDDDPLDLPLRIGAVAQNGGITVTLDSDDPRTVREVQHRARQLEARATPRPR